MLKLKIMMDLDYIENNYFENNSDEGYALKESKLRKNETLHNFLEFVSLPIFQGLFCNSRQDFVATKSQRITNDGFVKFKLSKKAGKTQEKVD